MASIVRDRRIELIEAHPNLFHPPVGAREATQGYPTCGDGWRDLLECLSTRIEAAIAEGGGSLRVLQIQAKYGTLRFYWRGELSDESGTKVEEAIALAEARSACTCEECGEAGRLYLHGETWMTRCLAHAKNEPVRIEAGLESFHVIRLTELHNMRVFFCRGYDRTTDAFVATRRQPARSSENGSFPLPRLRRRKHVRLLRPSCLPEMRLRQRPVRALDRGIG